MKGLGFSVEGLGFWDLGFGIRGTWALVLWFGFWVRGFVCGFGI